MMMMSNHPETSPLATLCYKAGSTLDEVLALEEEELFELSKEIVGNTVLDHARVLKQWRRCRLEEMLRKEVETELQNERRDDENERQAQDSRVNNETLQQQEQERQKEKLEQFQREQHEQIRHDWQEYVRTQVRQEMLHHEHELLPDSDSDSVPHIIEAQSACSPYQYAQDDSFEEETWYSLNDMPVLGNVGKVALDVMGILENGLSDFLLGPPEEDEKQKSKRRKKRSKSKREVKEMSYVKATEETNYRQQLPMPKEIREMSNVKATEKTDYRQQLSKQKLSLLL